jgi:hypothetical protein
MAVEAILHPAAADVIARETILTAVTVTMTVVITMTRMKMKKKKEKKEKEKRQKENMEAVMVNFWPWSHLIVAKLFKTPNLSLVAQAAGVVELLTADGHEIHSLVIKSE